MLQLSSAAGFDRNDVQLATNSSPTLYAPNLVPVMIGESRGNTAIQNVRLNRAKQSDFMFQLDKERLENTAYRKSTTIFIFYSL